VIFYIRKATKLVAGHISASTRPMAEQHRHDRPMLILSGDRTTHKATQWTNLTAGKAVAEAVRTTLGPNGMDKMLVSDDGTVVITNDGITILKEMNIEHPAAQMLVEVAEAQATEVGDGTTTAVTLAGELLSQAETLLNQDLHPTTIVSGYQQAANQSEQLLKSIATHVDTTAKAPLRRVARTAMTGKGAEADHLSELVVRAVQAVIMDGVVDPDRIRIETASGVSEDSELLKGIVLDASPVHENMPTAATDANVALLDTALEVPETDLDAEINVSNPDQLQAFLDQETTQLESQADALVDVGADVVVCQDAIDRLVQEYLARAGLLAVSDADHADLEGISQVTGARIAGAPTEIEAGDLGFARNIEQEQFGAAEQLVVRGAADVSTVTLLVRGGTDHVVTELERAVQDAVSMVSATVADDRLLPGGGASATELAMGLREYAATIDSREQQAIEAVADALDTVPQTLAENAGRDPIDTLVKLRAQHDDGVTAAGVEAETGEVVEMDAAGVVQPLSVLIRAVDSATEAAGMIVRIDDVINAGEQLNVSGTQGGISRPLGQELKKDIRNQAINSAAATVETPDEVLPNDPFDLDIHIDGEFEALTVILPDGLDYTTEVEEAPSIEATEAGSLRIETTGERETLQKLNLMYTRLPESPQESVEIEIKLKISEQELRTYTESVTIQRPKLETRVSKVAPKTDDDTRELEIELYNSSSVRLDADIKAFADGNQIAVYTSPVKELATGFLNIGLHRLTAEELASGPLIDDETKRVTLSNAVRSVMQALAEGSVDPPEPYDQPALASLSDSLQLMLNRDNMTPLSNFYPEVIKSVLRAETREYPAESIRLNPIVDQFRLPPDTSEFDLQIWYSDSADNLYPPQEHTITTQNSIDRTEPLRINAQICGIHAEGK